MSWKKDAWSESNAARYGGNPAPSTGNLGGWRARYDGPCHGGCDTTVVQGETLVWPTKRGWACVACAGVSDE